MTFESISDSITLDAAPDTSLLRGGSECSAIVRHVVARLERLGATIHPASRLIQYAKQFEQEDNPSSVTLDQALLESLQFLAVARALEKANDTSEWLPKVSAAASGAMNAPDDRSDARARSEQFELFVMACLTEAGFAVSATEPDLRIQIDRQQVAFAAKRLRSTQKLRRNLRDASNQLARHKLPGFAVLDLSFVTRLTKPTYIQKLSQQQAIAAMILDDFVEKNSQDVFEATERPYVAGVILHASTIGRSIEPLARFVSRRWLLCASHDSKITRTVASAIQRIGSRPVRAF